MEITMFVAQQRSSLLVIFLTILLSVRICTVFSLNNTRIEKRKVVWDHSIPMLAERPYSWEKCPVLITSEAEIDIANSHEMLKFKPWLKGESFWNSNLEKRYQDHKKRAHLFPLQVYIIPHSHNEVGWQNTFEEYYLAYTINILTLLVRKMQQFEDLTFIWNEVSFLAAWWEGVEPTTRKKFIELVKSGRLEITTGGWVMADEANSHVFAMLDQLIEGHQWIQSNLNITPSISWSIDSYGHSTSFPYILSKSGIKGTVIQRVHFVWKQWLALKQYGDFYWIPGWEPLTNQTNRYSKPSGTLLTHNMPFDSKKISCGVNPSSCLSLDFMSDHAQFIDSRNIRKKAEYLLGQYSRAASLFSHNVILTSIGGNFAYSEAHEFDSQYKNYKLLIDYININKKYYEADIKFGTPKDYFEEIIKRSVDFPTLSGDFFVYANVDKTGESQYWSGYFTTRPYMKILSRELEHSLRNAEILFTYALNDARQNERKDILASIENYYEHLVFARRNLGLFQNHQGISGGSKQRVMNDYGVKLFESIKNTIRIQEFGIGALTTTSVSQRRQRHFAFYNMGRDSYDVLPTELPIRIRKYNRRIILFNSLAQSRSEVVRFRINTTNILIKDSEMKEILFQINPVWNAAYVLYGNMEITHFEYEVMFLAVLPPLSLTTFHIVPTTKTYGNLSTVYCNHCMQVGTRFTIRDFNPGHLYLENNKLKLFFNKKTGFLEKITKKSTNSSCKCAMKFNAYRSKDTSDAYIFKTDTEHLYPEQNILEDYSSNVKVVVIAGPIATEISAIYSTFLTHSVVIFHSNDTSLSEAILMENIMELQSANTDLFMRLQTGINNGDPPVLYTDSNGFQYQKRVKIPNVGINGNYYPMTTMAFIQDSDFRLTLISNHAQGVSSFKQGFLEVMLDRRVKIDESIIKSFQISDNKLTTHKYWLVLENVALKESNQGEECKHHNYFKLQPEKRYQMPSNFVNHLSNSLNYPINIYMVKHYRFPLKIKESVNLLKHSFPSDVHLLNLRTRTDDALELYPSSEALLILHRQGYCCRVGEEVNHTFEYPEGFPSKIPFEVVDIASMTMTSLTGIHNEEIIKDMRKLRMESIGLQTIKIVFYD